MYDEQLFHLFSEPVPYTLPEGCALIYRRGLNKEAYQEFRNEGVARNFDVYPTYNSLKDYRQNFLRPRGIIESDGCIEVPLQNICDWQLGRLFVVKPDVQAEAVRLIALRWKVHCLIKWGAGMKAWCLCSWVRSITLDDADTPG